MKYRAEIKTKNGMNVIQECKSYACFFRSAQDCTMLLLDGKQVVPFEDVKEAVFIPVPENTVELFDMQGSNIWHINN